MARCEDFPCCGHVEDGVSFCPDSSGRFNCAVCGRKLAKNASSSLCKQCLDHDPDMQDYREDDSSY